MAVEDDDEGPMATVAVGFGFLVTWLSIAGSAFLASDRFLLAGLQSNSAAAQDASTFGILLIVTFLVTIAPFLAVALWGSVHGVAVHATSGAGTIPLDPVPLFGVVDGGLEPFAMVLLVLVGLVTASRWTESVVGRAVGGTVLGSFGYVVPVWLFMILSAIVYNLFADVLNSLLAKWVGVAGDVELAPMIVYPDTVGAFVHLGMFAAPFIAGGAVVNAAFVFLTADRSGPASSRQSRLDSGEFGESQSRDGEADGTSTTDAPTADRSTSDGGAETTSVFDQTADSAPGANTDQENRWRDEWYEEDQRRDEGR